MTIIHSPIKNRIKQFIPPILTNKIFYFRNYFIFLKYKDLLINNIKLKNIHKGEKCFILGSGPSINDEDLKPLKNEIVFALNNFYVHPDFNEIVSGNSEKYFMTAPIHPPQTEKEWKDWLCDMEDNMPENSTMIFGLNRNDINIKYICDQYNLFNNNKIYWYFSGKIVNEYYNYSPQDVNITKMIWIADTVSIYTLIIAIYMGFSEIYMLGMDHNYICNKKNKKRFYQDGIHQLNEDQRLLKGSSEVKHSSKALYNIFSQYEMLKKNTSKRIYNISENSLLDVYDYAKMSDVIK